MRKTARLFKHHGCPARTVPRNDGGAIGRRGFRICTRRLPEVQTLIGLGAPIDGEAGVGYLLRAKLFLPPLMFGEEELEALVLCARWVKGQNDPALARAADSTLAKIATASPKDLREETAEIGLWVP